MSRRVVVTLTILGSVALSLGILLLGGLLLNRVPLVDPPGFKKRLALYLTTNVAETRTDNPFPELQPVRYQLDAPTLLELARQTVVELGWTETHYSEAALEIRAIVQTRLWRFNDDVIIRIESGDRDAGVYVRSQSRVGKGDLGANTRHVLDFYQALEPRVKRAISSGQ
jgi:uncharacterized protein (DUF1499 family)